MVGWSPLGLLSTCWVKCRSMCCLITRVSAVVTRIVISWSTHSHVEIQSSLTSRLKFCAVVLCPPARQGCYCENVSSKLSTYNFLSIAATMPRELEPSNNEKAFVTEALQQGLRMDERKLDEFRTVDIAFGEEYGLADVKLGKTRWA